MSTWEFLEYQLWRFKNIKSKKISYLKGKVTVVYNYSQKKKKKASGECDGWMFEDSQANWVKMVPEGSFGAGNFPIGTQ